MTPKPAGKRRRQKATLAASVLLCVGCAAPQQEAREVILPPDPCVHVTLTDTNASPMTIKLAPLGKQWEGRYWQAECITVTVEKLTKPTEIIVREVLPRRKGKRHGH